MESVAEERSVVCLGSVILYDILVNQTPATEEEAVANDQGKFS